MWDHQEIEVVQYGFNEKHLALAERDTKHITRVVNPNELSL